MIFKSWKGWKNNESSSKKMNETYSIKSNQIKRKKQHHRKTMTSPGGLNRIVKMRKKEESSKLHDLSRLRSNSNSNRSQHSRKLLSKCSTVPMSHRK
jgi:hypothetical protein